MQLMQPEQLIIKHINAKTSWYKFAVGTFYPTIYHPLKPALGISASPRSR
jgi:hypothetical protein